MSTVWTMLVCLTLICFQVATLWSVCRRHRREMAAHVGAMAILTAAMQPRETRAHCIRVADISERIAQELRLSAKRLALVRAIGILHEIEGIDSITRNTPLEFAILGVADYYDRLTHDGSESLELDEAMEEIRRGAGTRFEPVVIKALMTVTVHSTDEKREPGAASCADDESIRGQADP